MADLAILKGFTTSLKVVEAGNRAVGGWVRMAAWSAQWAEDGIPCLVPKSAKHLFELKNADVIRLLAAGLIEDAGNHWRVLGEGLLWKLVVPPRSRIPDQLRATVYDRDGYACVKCGATDRLSLDHIKPWSLGGKDTIDNLQTLCPPCNSAKGNRVEVDT